LVESQSFQQCCCIYETLLRIDTGKTKRIFMKLFHAVSHIFILTSFVQNQGSRHQRTLRRTPDVDLKTSAAPASAWQLLYIDNSTGAMRCSRLKESISWWASLTKVMA
jgi:hypothetical protein